MAATIGADSLPALPAPVTDPTVSRRRNVLALFQAYAESAVAKMVACKPNVALVDINLPGLSGIECVRSLKPRLPETQFVMVTVYDDSTHIFDALSAGAT